MKQLATLIVILLILYLFWMDRKKIEGVSSAIWIPFFWMFLSSSRYVSQWFDLGTPDLTSNAILDGSPYDRAVFTLLIIAGALVLLKRRIKSNVFTQNTWVWLYFLFGAVSFIWCDYPFSSFKRWNKAIGNVIMALVVLTEERPSVSLGVILRRLAFLLVPLSVLFIDFYPALGRTFTKSGATLYTGVANQKNGLGQICLLSGIYFSWDILLGRKELTAPEQRLHYSVYLIILPMIAWLLHMANSATSIACLGVAICLFAVGRLPAMLSKPQKILYLVIAGVALFGIMQLTFNVKDTIISMLGRRPDLTNRTYIWNDVLSMVRNPLIGFGYEGFWNVARLQNMYEGTNSVHNGYIEVYLNLGLIGLFFVLAWIVSGLIKVQRHLGTDYPAAMLRLCFIVVITLYNWTEATFAGVSTIWMLLLFAVMNAPEMQEPERKSTQSTPLP